LTKAFDRLFDTGRVLLFHWRFTGQNKADIDALLEKYEEFFNGEILKIKKIPADLSKGNQKKVGIIATLIGNEVVILTSLC
jgi:ABC-type uncharacterized transport system ATPase subunit